MKHRNKALLAARRRKAVPHQDGARRPEVMCSWCQDRGFVLRMRDDAIRWTQCPACSGEEGR